MMPDLRLWSCLDCGSQLWDSVHRYASGRNRRSRRVDTPVAFITSHPVWAAIFMRALLPVLLVIVVSIAACSKPLKVGVPFETGTTWRPVEQASLLQIPEFMRPGQSPEYRATWTNGEVRYVCLDCDDFGGISIGWTVYVFDDAGRLIVHNSITGRDSPLHTPRRLLSVSPLRVVFADPNQEDVQEVLEPTYTKEQWQARMRETARRWEEFLAKWKAEKKTKQE